MLSSQGNGGKVKRAALTAKEVAGCEIVWYPSIVRSIGVDSTIDQKLLLKGLSSATEQFLELFFPEELGRGDFDVF